MSDSLSVLHRHPKTRNFTQIENDLIRDKRLSFRATGLLIYLLSLPNGSAIDSNSLTSRKTEGRDAIRTAYAELVAAQYVERSRVQSTEDGKWRTVIHVYEVPKTDSQASGIQSSGIRASVSQAVSTKGSNTDEQDGEIGSVCEACGAEVLSTVDLVCHQDECPGAPDPEGVKAEFAAAREALRHPGKAS